MGRKSKSETRRALAQKGFDAFTVLGAVAARSAGRGLDEVTATQHGIHAALLVGAVLSLLTVPVALLFRAPAGSSDQPMTGH